MAHTIMVRMLTTVSQSCFCSVAHVPLLLLPYAVYVHLLTALPLALKLFALVLMADYDKLADRFIGYMPPDPDGKLLKLLDSIRLCV